MALNKIVVGAHYGLKDWFAQRVTAIYMAVFSLVFLAIVFFCDKQWAEIFESGCIKFFTFLFFVSVAYHAWVGVRDIWMDYVKPVFVRLTLHVITLFVLLGVLGWAVRILWRV